MMNYHAECVYVLQMMGTHNAKKKSAESEDFILFMNAICDEHQGNTQRARERSFCSLCLVLAINVKW